VAYVTAKITIDYQSGGAGPVGTTTLAPSDHNEQSLTPDHEVKLFMRIKLALVPLAVAAALLGGCATTNGPAAPTTATTTTPASNGVADLPADQIVAKAQTALGNATSFHIKGTTTDQGTATTLDLTYAGKNVKGTIGSAGLSLDILVLGNDGYLKASEAFWKAFIPPAQQAMIGQFKDKWVKVDLTAPSFASFKEIADPAKQFKPDGTPTKGEAKTINGTPAIGVVDSSDKSVVYIATQGEPLPLEADGPGASDKLEFTEYNSPVDLQAPPAADVVDLTSFKG
jgi:hypothetical protein